MDFSIFQYETFVEDVEYIYTCRVYEFLWEPAHVYVCVYVCVFSMLICFSFITATVFPSPSSDLKSTGAETFNSSQVLARILGLEKVISLSFVLD